MPGLRVATKTKAVGVKKVSAVKAKSSQPGCGSGSGGFKPGNTCGKGKRQALAEKIRATRKHTIANGGDVASLRQDVRAIKNHRRGHENSISNDQARAIHDRLKKAPETPPKIAAKSAPKPETMRVIKQSSPKSKSIAAKVEKPSDTPKPETKSVDHKVSPGLHETDADILKTAKTFLGKDASMQDLANLSGSPHGSDIKIFNRGEYIAVKTEGDGFRSTRQISKDDDGKLFIENKDFHVDKSRQGQGIGTKVFGDQVTQAKSKGVSYIQAECARGEGLNGYYTWARFGYDATIPPDVHGALPPEHKSAVNVSDLMRTQGGRDSWLKHGKTIEMKFDLSPGSNSLKVWDAYRAAKGAN